MKDALYGHVNRISFLSEMFSCVEKADITPSFDFTHYNGMSKILSDVSKGLMDVDNMIDEIINEKAPLDLTQDQTGA